MVPVYIPGGAAEVCNTPVVFYAPSSPGAVWSGLSRSLSGVDGLGSVDARKA